jgi:hypothetical protein
MRLSRHDIDSTIAKLQSLSLGEHKPRHWKLSRNFHLRHARRVLDFDSAIGEVEVRERLWPCCVRGFDSAVYFQRGVDDVRITLSPTEIAFDDLYGLVSLETFCCCIGMCCNGLGNLVAHRLSGRNRNERDNQLDLNGLQPAARNPNLEIRRICKTGIVMSNRPFRIAPRNTNIQRPQRSRNGLKGRLLNQIVIHHRPRNCRPAIIHLPHQNPTTFALPRLSPHAPPIPVRVAHRLAPVRSASGA